MHANQSAYLDQAVGWAAKHNINVIICLHGVPGSQNGKETSGRVGPVDWPDAQSNADRATKIVQHLAQTYLSPSAASQAVTHIQLLNEPVFDQNVDHIVSFSKQYYTTAHDAVASVGGSRGADGVVIHDGFLNLSSWYNFIPGSSAGGIMVDTHIYANMYPYHSSDARACSSSYWRFSFPSFRDATDAL